MSDLTYASGGMLLHAFFSGTETDNNDLLQRVAELGSMLQSREHFSGQNYWARQIIGHWHDCLLRIEHVIYTMSDDGDFQDYNLRDNQIKSLFRWTLSLKNFLGEIEPVVRRLLPLMYKKPAPPHFLNYPGFEDEKAIWEKDPHQF
jgi:hypothetical protein